MKKPAIKLPRPAEMLGRLHTRSFRVGGYSVLAAVIVIAIAVFANVLVGALPAKYTQFDTTSNSLYSLSEQTELLLSGLEDEVTVYWIVQDGAEDSTLGTLLERYTAASGELTVSKVDPDVQPTFVQQYVTGTVYNNSMSTYEKEEGDLDGPFALAVAITETLDDVETQIIWVSSAYLLDDATNAGVSGGNEDFFLN